MVVPPKPRAACLTAGKREVKVNPLYLRYKKTINFFKESHYADLWFYPRQHDNFVPVEKRKRNPCEFCDGKGVKPARLSLFNDEHRKNANTALYIDFDHRCIECDGRGESVSVFHSRKGG